MEDAEAIRGFCAEDEQDRNMREQELGEAFHAVMADIGVGAELNSYEGAPTQIFEIRGLVLHFCGDPEVLALVDKWVSEVASLTRHMHRHWTTPEKASLVALLDRFKAVLHHLLDGLIGDSVYAPALRQLTTAQCAQAKKLFVGVSPSLLLCRHCSLS